MLLSCRIAATESRIGQSFPAFSSRCVPAPSPEISTRLLIPAPNTSTATCAKPSGSFVTGLIGCTISIVPLCNEGCLIVEQTVPCTTPVHMLLILTENNLAIGVDAVDQRHHHRIGRGVFHRWR